MGRSTFEGPILSGDLRMGQFRDVGYTRLSQACTLDFSVTTNGATNYAGASTQFVTSADNGAAGPNIAVPVYTAGGGTTLPPVAVTPAADSATLIVRGAVMYIPVGCQIESMLVDYITTVTTAAGTVTGVSAQISNGYTTSAGTYGTVASAASAGRNIATMSAAQAGSAIYTVADIALSPGQPSQISQVVFNILIAGTTMTTLSAGKFNVTLNYLQNDKDVGSTTAYPYMNFD